MKPKDRNLVIAGVLLCLVIAVLAPFIASSNPDGLEKSAEQLMPNPETEPAVQAPLHDYTIPFLGEGPLSGILALVLGVLVTLVIAYLVARLLRRRNPPEASQ
jgi:cobalt/nickel transport protein